MKNRNSSSETSERGVCHGCLLKELYGQWMLEPFRGGRDRGKRRARRPVDVMVSELGLTRRHRSIDQSVNTRSDRSIQKVINHLLLRTYVFIFHQHQVR